MKKFKAAMFVSKKEYNENGYGIINDKFFQIKLILFLNNILNILLFLN